MSQPADSRRSARIAGEVAPPLEQPISLFCLVQGKPTEKAFPVDVEKNKTVGHLRKLIWKETQETFKNLDAKDLTLWAVSVPIGDGTVQVDLAQVEKCRLLPRSKIANTISEDDLADEGFYVIIEPPKGIHLPIARVIKRLQDPICDGIIVELLY
ncbi:7335_t:CDS:2 [Paraglomus brasilianum]|uniref:7335_t:CDS:1 n=1 Tax=Paraglomus brasilianum TaxID=144538 RepID=A0A9N9FAU9_9GLOM|nr:7335_t:CDS:2 [Paraglomus brasilianum]